MVAHVSVKCGIDENKPCHRRHFSACIYLRIFSIYKNIKAKLLFYKMNIVTTNNKKGAFAKLGTNIIIITGQYICPFCNAPLKDLNQITNETIAEYKINKICTCKLCYKLYKNPTELYQHIRSHFHQTNDKRKEFACVACTKEKNNYLFEKRSLELNNIEALFDCTICWQQFNVFGDYYSHRQVHFDRTVYTCDLCNKKFISEKR